MIKSPLIIIEDNEDDYEALTRGLKEKLDLIPCMIILDLNMPGIDGREMLGIIRKIEDLKATPVIIFTTSTDKRDIQQCYESGANSYIQKPVSYLDLKKSLKQFFEYWFNCAIIPNQT